MIILITFFALIEINSKINNFKWIYFIFVFLLSILFALRSDLTPDTAIYINAYKNINLFNLIYTNIKEFEFGYILFMALNKFVLGDDYRIFFFLVSIFGYTLIFFSSNEISDYLKSQKRYHMLILALYTSFYGIYYQGIVMRGGVAIALFSYSIMLFLNKKYCFSIVFYLLTFLFHKSAIFTVPVIYILLHNFNIRNIRQKKYYVFIVIFLLFIACYSVPGFRPNLLNFVSKYVGNIPFFYKFYAYIEHGNYGARIEFKSLYYMLLAFMFVRENIIDVNFNKLINIYIFGVYLSVIIGQFENINRLLDYYRVLYVYIYIYCITVAYQKRRYANKKIYFSFCTLMIVIFNYIMLMNNIFDRL